MRWGPAGGRASTADDGMVMLWRDKGGGLGAGAAARALRDVYDLSWSPSGGAPGSVDGSCIVWNIAKAKPQQAMRDHEHPSGVAWDPCDGFVVSVSSDRSARVRRRRRRRRRRASSRAPTC